MLTQTTFHLLDCVSSIQIRHRLQWKYLLPTYMQICTCYIQCISKGLYSYVQIVAQHYLHSTIAISCNCLFRGHHGITSQEKLIRSSNTAVLTNAVPNMWGSSFVSKQERKEKKGGYERFCSLGPHTNKILTKDNGIFSYAGTAEGGR